VARSGHQPSILTCAVTEPATTHPSYRALLGVPSLWRVLLAMQIARISQSMISIVMILFALQRYSIATVGSG
jgi:hypothetical protein